MELWTDPILSRYIKVVVRYRSNMDTIYKCLNRSEKKNHDEFF